MSLALFLRSRCKHCHKSVGLHWVFACAYACIAAVLLGFLAIYISVNFGRVHSLMGLASAILLMTYFVGRYAPLETKEAWWAP